MLHFQQTTLTWTMAAAQTASELPLPDVEVLISPEQFPPAADSSTDAETDANSHTSVKETTDTSLLHPLHVHKHRLCHNPSKLPGLRFVDRGLLQAQAQAQTPAQDGSPAGHLHPSLPQSTVSPPCSTGVDSRQDSTEPTITGSGTVRSENSAKGFPQSRLGSVTAVLDSSVKVVNEPVTSSTETSPTPLQPRPPPPPPQQHPLKASSTILLPVTEADETQSQSADDTSTEPVSTSNQRGRRASLSKRSPQFTSIRSSSEHSPLSQASTYKTAVWTAAPVTTPVAAKLGRSASLRITNVHATPAAANSSSPLAPRSEVGTVSSRYHTPSSRPRPRRNSSWDYTTPTSNPPPRRNFSWDSTNTPSPLTSRASKSNNANEWGPGQQENISPKVVSLPISNENNKTFPRRTSSASRPPTSYRPLPSGYATSGRIPPIRSLSLPGSRKSYFTDMNNSFARYYDNGDDGRDHDLTSRERSLRALEGRYTNDRSHDVAHPDPDDDVAESENNTADIFMSIAREDSSSSIPRRQTDRGSDDEQSTVVSTSCPFVFIRWRDVLRERQLLAHKFWVHHRMPICGMKCDAWSLTGLERRSCTLRLGVEST